MLPDFQAAVKTLLERVSVNIDTVPLTELEAGARTLEGIASEHGATGLRRLSKRLANLARTAHEMSAPVSVSVLDKTFKALERADPDEDVSKLTNALERLEEDAFLYTPPLGALMLEPTPVVEPAPSETSSGIRRVLSVDDSSLVRSALRRIFSESGAGIEEARNGAEALERFKEIGKYDLVLLDVNMPDMTGIELLPRLRERSTEVPVVMLTSEDDVKTAIAAIQQGADGYIQKQDLPLEGDRSAFFHALEQARETRAGIVARQQLESLKADFYSMVTHDLKNPTSIIQLALEQVGDASTLTDNQRRALEVAGSAAQDLLRLVTEYLDYASIDAGYLNLEHAPEDFARIVRDSAERARLLADRRSQVLSVDVPESLNASVDAARISQVLDNLVSNAVKYTPEGGLVVVRLTSSEAFVKFSVTDTGNGIPADQIGRLFKRYQRLPGESRRSSGTGLGLVIVKAIVEAHGGRVWAESAGIGEGSTFSFELPL
jgi:two-component system, sensor histidine kinase and response regulator